MSNEWVRSIIQHYNIGHTIIQVDELESGFQSDNYRVLTDKGNFVIRILHDTAENITYAMNVYNYLASHGVKTPQPQLTKQNNLVLPHEGKIIVIQTFLEGSAYYEDENLEKVDQFLPLYGRELGRVHQVLLQMVADQGTERLSKRQDTVSYVKEAGLKYMPDIAYIDDQYKLWKEDISKLPCNELTRAVIHGDVGPKDFFFKDDVFSGILDFNAASYDYLLFDIASMMMYCGLYGQERSSEYTSFIKAYLSESPVKKDELKWLHIILRTRWLLQVFYHQYRYVKGITQGLETAKAEENLQGVKDGVYFLKVTGTLPDDYFYTIITL
ncbi:MAG: phosphotransferase [Candidatus Odinarchaeota archaeon]